MDASLKAAAVIWRRTWKPPVMRVSKRRLPKEGEMSAVPNYLRDLLWDGKLPQDLSGLDWNFVRFLREEALERFLQKGLPSTKDEDWRYTNLKSIEKSVWHRILGTSNIQDTIPSIAGDRHIARVLFVDGFHSTAHTRLKRLPPGLHITSLQEALQERNEKVREFLQEAPSESWHDLNMAMFDDGVLIQVDPGVKIEQPLEIVFMATPTDMSATYHTRLMFDLGEGSSLDVVELRQARPGPSLAERFITSVSSYHLAEGARLRQTAVVDGANKAIGLIHKSIGLAENASCEINYLHLGGKLMRESAEIHHKGKGSRSMLRSINLADGQHLDLMTSIRHSAPNTESQQEIRAIARNKGHAVFQGKVQVESGAHKTNARQMHRGLLLSEDAECDAKPSLEIYADDVQCGHGSTCGALDEEALFYMQSRGLSKSEAEHMLIEAFIFALFEDGDFPARDATLDLLRPKVRGL
jgi:Fe-S cluster assembly protein SufD